MMAPGFGIGPVEVLILLVAGGFFFFIIAGAFRRRGTASGGDNQLHPNLKNCPGCNAPIPENAGTCSHCGLRISS